jgi:hypothetical protein
MRKPTISFTGSACIAAASAVLVVPWPGAGAESCLEQVRSLAASHGVSSDPPAGGVITPPRDQSYGMPTMPNVAPTPPFKEDGSRSAPPSGGPDLTSLQALLVAARAEAERGNESECLERLEKAREVIERAGR